MSKPTPEQIAKPSKRKSRIPKLIPIPETCEHTLRNDFILGGEYCTKCLAHFNTQQWP